MSQGMRWDRLLSEARLGDPKPVRPRLPNRSPFMVDYDRIVFSAPFRRLQDKTQVHPLPQSDYVRRRLTHSLEVSCIGRSLGIEIGYFLKEQGLLPGHIPPEDLGFIVAASCLAHDIGNPPFGHAGEEVIGGWFAQASAPGHPLSALLNRGLTRDQLADFVDFEGNAQGFRIVARRQMYQDEGGLRLTLATLGAGLKYPCLRASQARAAHKGKSSRKYGAFQAEAHWLDEVALGSGMLKRGDGLYARHPLSFLMEAADDIAYAVVDLEDGLKLDYLSAADVISALDRLAGGGLDLSRAGRDDFRKVEYLRARAIGNLVEAAARVFRERHRDILSGDFDDALIAHTPLAEAHDHATKTLALPRIFRSKAVIRMEIKGFQAVGDLMDRFAGAAIRAHGDGVSALDARHWRLVPDLPELVKGKAPDGAGLYDTLLAVTDFVSGMTDGYALKLHRELTGSAG